MSGFRVIQGRVVGGKAVIDCTRVGRITLRAWVLLEAWPNGADVVWHSGIGWGRCVCAAWRPWAVHSEFLEKAVPGEEECPHKMR